MSTALSLILADGHDSCNRDCATATVNTLRINARILLSKFAEMEEIPFTLNEHYLRDVKQKVLARFQEIRHPGQTGQGDDASSAGSDGEMEPDISDEMKDAMAAFKKKFGWSVVLATTHEPEKAEKPAADPYQEELELMAFIRAYWQIAYKVRLRLSQTLLTDDRRAYLAAHH